MINISQIYSKSQSDAMKLKHRWKILPLYSLRGWYSSHVGILYILDSVALTLLSTHRLGLCHCSKNFIEISSCFFNESWIRCQYRRKGLIMHFASCSGRRIYYLIPWTSVFDRHRKEEFNVILSQIRTTTRDTATNVFQTRDWF